MERTFSEYIQRIDDITEDKDINIEETAKKAEQELLKDIVDCEKKLDNLQNRKKQVMEQYVQGIIEFDEYKSMIKMFNENYNVLENELQDKKAELPNIMETPDIYPEDIVTNLKQNWEKLNDSERMIFLQRFVKKINVTVEKEKGKTTAVKIDGIDYHTEEPQKRKTVRSKMRGF